MLNKIPLLSLRLQQTTLQVEPIKEYNHIYRITTDLNQVFYIKIFTKDWYGGDIAGTGFCVDHEVTAWQTLKQHGLGVPSVALYDTGCFNPLERPYLMTAAMPGTRLTDFGSEDLTHALKAVGQYLRQMHAITFANAGYISSRGLDTPPDPNAWQHTIWTFQAFEAEALRVFAEDAHHLPTTLLKQVQTFYEQHKHDLEATYRIPHFAPGDCHASHFYLLRQGDDLTVTGVLDMEVASAGDCINDFVKFFIEAAAVFPHESKWWDALFEGYGHAPDFNQVKLRMLCAGHHNYSFIWQGTRAEILQHLYHAQSWSELFDMSRKRD